MRIYFETAYYRRRRCTIVSCDKYETIFSYTDDLSLRKKENVPSTKKRITKTFSIKNQINFFLEIIAELIKLYIFTIKKILIE